jgi:kumamolisin
MHPTGEPANVTPYPATAPIGSGIRPAIQSRSASTTAGPQPCTGDGTISDAQPFYGFGYLANQIAQAYDLQPFYQQGDEGQGQTIALLELEPNRADDIDAYQGCYGTHATVNYFAVDGGINGDRSTDTTDPGAGEAALDIEQIVGLAPKATIDVYQAPNSAVGVLDAYQEMVNNPAVTIISTSWGACETGNPVASLETATFATAAQDGITIFAAAGDSGSTDCGTSAPAVDDPASDPYVTGVGGTTMPNLNSVAQQFAWNGSAIGNGVTGGGFSSLWGEPSWQQASAVQAEAMAATANELSCPGVIGGGYCRAVPDVSADADPYTGYIIYLTQDVYDPQTETTSPQITAVPWGGTSAAAPLWAAVTALINASPDCNGHNLGFVNPLLYQAALKGMPGLTDITAGNNNNTPDDPSAYFSAARGYDPVTGLGTPLGVPLGQSLCAEADTLTLSAPVSESSTYGQAVSVTGISASDAQGHALTYTATGLPQGLSLDPSTGTIGGTPTADANATVRLTVTAADNSATKTSIIPWTVTGAPTTTPPPTGTGTATTPTTTTKSRVGEGQGSTKKVPRPRVVHLTRRYRGHSIRVTLTITGATGHQHLVVSYDDSRDRSRTALKTVQLELRPEARVGRGAGHARSRPVVLTLTRKPHGNLAVALTPARIKRGVDLVLRYRAGAFQIRLPRL